MLTSACDRKLIAAWLAVCLFMVALMVAAGGYTRLSGSGLSITQWKPLHGAVPPRSEQEWLDEFAAYRATPQYAKINPGMTLEEFKAIFWPEYAHRLLGRSIGMVFLLPFLVFLARRSLSQPFALRLGGVLALGALQGVAGWIMVASGLVDRPYVEPVKLALHLGLAVAIFALLLWALLDVAAEAASGERETRDLRAGVRWHGKAFTLLLALLFLQILLGALTAGLHAGLVYNTFPKMNEYWLPPELSSPQPWLENPVLAQFLHRFFAVFLLIALPIWWIFARRHVSDSFTKCAVWCMLALLALQFVLGVLTLLLGVPLWLALTHQLNALALFASALVAQYRIHNES